MHTILHTILHTKLHTIFRQVFIDSYEDLKLFLQSDESLYLYASSQVDIAAIASLFHINVWIYTYNVQALDHNGQRQSNR